MTAGAGEHLAAGLGPGARLPALVALLVVGAALAAVVAVSTPWRTLPPVAAPTPVSVSRDFSPAEVAKQQALYRQSRPPALAGAGVALVLTLALGLTPLGARLIGAVAKPLGGGWGWRAALGALALTLVGTVVRLPFAARGEVVARRFGLSTRSWGGFWLDQAKGFALGAALTVLVALGLYALIRVAPRLWWAPAAVGAAVLTLLLSFVAPVLIEPVFNHFTPLPAGQLRTSLLTLAQRDGVPVRDVMEADASKRTTALNAYVSGFGATRRIVVYDTTLERASPTEIELIVAHELGHAKRQDVLWMSVTAALAAAAGVCLLFVLLTARPLLRAAGVGTAADPRSLALLLALATLLGAVGGPAQMLVSRRIEARADVHALELTREPAQFAAMQRRLAVANISELAPSPLVYALFASHPTSPERIAVARDWARLRHLPPPPDLAPKG